MTNENQWKKSQPILTFYFWICWGRMKKKLTVSISSGLRFKSKASKIQVTDANHYDKSFNKIFTFNRLYYLIRTYFPNSFLWYAFFFFIYSQFIWFWLCTKLEAPCPIKLSWRALLSHIIDLWAFRAVRLFSFSVHFHFKLFAKVKKKKTWVQAVFPRPCEDITACESFISRWWI
jgi:hypothetical protein